MRNQYVSLGLFVAALNEPPLPTLLKYARLSYLPVEYFIDDDITVQLRVTK